MYQNGAIAYLVFPFLVAICIFGVSRLISRKALLISATILSVVCGLVLMVSIEVVRGWEIVTILVVTVGVIIGTVLGTIVGLLVKK